MKSTAGTVAPMTAGRNFTSRAQNSLFRPHKARALVQLLGLFCAYIEMGLALKRKRDKEVLSPRRQVQSEESGEPDYTGGAGVSEGEGAEEDSVIDDHEEEEDGGLPVAGRVPQEGTHTKKPPTGEELRNIKDATDLYRSSSFKLQIDALLPNIRPKQRHVARLEHFLLSLHNFLNSLPAKQPRNPVSASRDLLKKGIAVPFISPYPTEDTNWKVAFEKPSDILVVGSWATKTSVKAKDSSPFGIDVAVEIPNTIIQEKDYRNGRFFQKRAYYLAVIAAALMDEAAELGVEVFYESALGDPRLTTVVIRSKSADGSQNDFGKLNAQIRIIPFLPNSPIPLQRLSPSKSNLRAAAADGQSKEDIPTPLSHAFHAPKSHLLSIHSLKEQVACFSDALALLRVWSNQRGYGVGNKLCVRGFEGKGTWWAEILNLLVNGEETSGPGFSKSAKKRKPLGKGISSYQLFKAALDFLARHDFSQERIFDYSSHDAVFVDSVSAVNLLANVPLSSLDMLRYDAKLTLEALDNPEDHSHLYFSRTLETSRRGSILSLVDLSLAALRTASPQLVADHGSVYNALLATLESTLRRGLGNRAKAIAILHPSSQLRPTSQAQPSYPSVIFIGLIVDTEHAFRLVDHGPSAEEQDSDAAGQFRDFWGDKAELRRFKDGSITESVVWEVTNLDERAHVPCAIMRYLLKRHCGVSDDAVLTWQAQFDGMLKLPESITAMYQAGNASTGFKAAQTALDRFVKQVKALDKDLPLAILNISPIKDSLRYTSVFVPVALPAASISGLPTCAQYSKPMEVVIEFEKSGRWPDDLRAIQKIKLAFFERIATALMGSVKGLKANVVIGDGITTSDIQDQALLEIIMPEGWIFHARIWHEREAVLLDRLIDDQPHVPKHLKRTAEGFEVKERRAALEAREVYTRRFIHAPRHHRAIASLCHRFTAYAGTVRLVKRWLASHWLLNGHVSEEVVEILCASIFLGPAGNAKDPRVGSPSSKERGFAQVVEFLKDWDWTTGLMVPLYGSAEHADLADKPVVPVTAGAKSGVWTVATELDPDGHVWTSPNPDVLVAHRVQAIAKATWGCLQHMEGGGLDVKTLFAHPVEHYNFLVDMDPAVLPRYYQNVGADPAVWAKKSKFCPPALPGFDPAQLLYNDLKRIYKDTFVLFHDPLGGCRFGAVWDPTLQKAKPFRVLGGFSSVPAGKNNEKSKDKSSVVLNESAILNEIERWVLV
ncbi:Nucleolar protein 6 [Grifola frondosa]|uniref:U3 small nucleolar RNA-associated protein 22 n=1 Tax=Grifola frondosa TaxID=5627 RepID=A0A1C7MQR9_GRIFR|nr:Nucleolar protein 6 [Grifola frondosa]